MGAVPPSPISPTGAPRAEPVAGLSARDRFHGLQPVLPVADVSRSARWFCEVLGFELDFMAGEPPSYGRVKHVPADAAENTPARLDAAGATNLWQVDRRCADPVYIRLWQCGPHEKRPWRGEIVIHVGHDLDGLHATYAARGVTVLEPPVSQPWGLREFAIREPDGHVLRFCGYL